MWEDDPICLICVCFFLSFFLLPLNSSWTHTHTRTDGFKLDRSYNQSCIRPSWGHGPRSLIRADWWQRSLTSDMSALKGHGVGGWGVGLQSFCFVLSSIGKTARQDLTLHQLNDAEPNEVSQPWDEGGLWLIWGLKIHLQHIGVGKKKLLYTFMSYSSIIVSESHSWRWCNQSW